MKTLTNDSISFMSHSVVYRFSRHVSRTVASHSTFRLLRKTSYKNLYDWLHQKIIHHSLCLTKFWDLFRSVLQDSVSEFLRSLDAEHYLIPINIFLISVKAVGERSTLPPFLVGLPGGRVHSL
jgi:hypothetical protein